MERRSRYKLIIAITSSYLPPPPPSPPPPLPSLLVFMFLCLVLKMVHEHIATALLC